MWTNGLLSILVACFAPSIVMLGYYALKDKYEPEPLRLLFGVFATGMLAAPVALLGFEVLGQFSFYRWLSDIDQAYDAEKLAYCLFAIGPLEEMAKFMAVWITVYRYRVIDEPVDGMVYAAAAALGFATYENWYAMVVLDDLQWGRAITLPFNHVLFSSFWGYALGVELCRQWRTSAGTWLVVTGLVLSFVYHGLYDYVLLNEHLSDLWILPLVLFLWVWVSSALRGLVARSPFRT